jgi:hypothetical protein
MMNPSKNWRAREFSKEMVTDRPNEKLRCARLLLIPTLMLIGLVVATPTHGADAVTVEEASEAAQN